MKKLAILSILSVVLFCASACDYLPHEGMYDMPEASLPWADQTATVDITPTPLPVQPFASADLEGLSVHPGMGMQEVESVLGAPTSKSENVESVVEGRLVTTWYYPDMEMVFNVDANTKQGTLLTVSCSGLSNVEISAAIGPRGLSSGMSLDSIMALFGASVENGTVVGTSLILYAQAINDNAPTPPYGIYYSSPNPSNETSMLFVAPTNTPGHFATLRITFNADTKTATSFSWSIDEM